MDTNGKQYKISVVCPIYNAEAFLAETIESVVQQTIGFEESIQLILVDNGSTDHSAEICREYAGRYPENIAYFTFPEKHNIAAARNFGFTKANGWLVTFLDADDTWSQSSFSEIYQFFQKNNETVDIVFSKIRTFGAGKSTLLTPEDLYPKTMLVDIDQNPDLIQLHLNSAVIKKEALHGVLFDEKLTSANEIVFLTNFILDRKQYGFVSEAQYNFRKRADNCNAERTLYLSEGYYTDDLTEGLVGLAKKSNELFGRVHDYVQLVLIQVVFGRIKARLYTVRGKELEQYKNNLRAVLSYVSDDMVLKVKGQSIEYSIYLYRLKYGDILDKITCKNGVLYLDKVMLYKLKRKKFFDLIIIEIENGTVVLEGRAGLPIPDALYSIYLKDNKGRIYPCNNFSKHDYHHYALEDEILHKSGFSIRIPAEKDLKLNACIKIFGKEYKIHIKYGDWSKISNTYSHSYYFKDGIVIYKKEDMLCIEKGQKRRRFEQQYLKELRDCHEDQSVKMRLIRHLMKKVSKKKVWLFVDRVNSADENAEFLFEYVNSVCPPDIKCYYVLGKDSPEYERMKQKGNVLDYGSKRYYRLYFTANKYITSQTTGFILLPRGVNIDAMKDLLPKDFVYLQHGVMEKDFSQLQNKLAFNFRIFLTSAYPEYQSMLDLPYGYTEREIKLTGLARHDKLMKEHWEKGKNIIIAPTWRNNIAGQIDPKSGGRVYNPLMKESDFFHFYNDLINDERLLNCMKKHGYKGIVRLHHYMMPNIRDFDANDCFSFYDGTTTYHRQFDGCALLVTDYSSIATDYAYISCPVIYSQFDIDTFYQNHTYEAGYFDYERDGFGPVCYDYDSTVSKIIEYIESGCVMEEQYESRRKAFFAHFDGENCKRIYEEILKIDKGDNNEN